VRGGTKNEYEERNKDECACIEGEMRARETKSRAFFGHFFLQKFPEKRACI